MSTFLESSISQIPSICCVVSKFTSEECQEAVQISPPCHLHSYRGTKNVLQNMLNALRYSWRIFCCAAKTKLCFQCSSMKYNSGPYIVKSMKRVQTWNLSRTHGHCPCKNLLTWGKIKLWTYVVRIRIFSFFLYNFFMYNKYIKVVTPHLCPCKVCA